ncbi:aldose 1-epimerase family protein [Corynebacterium frankenforstense]|uniref:aldose 1-epimerase family protein n=2 Tax=Corynebacterium frankenforstense TaxID=1230998 RepID=UPI0009F8B2B2
MAQIITYNVIAHISEWPERNPMSDAPLPPSPAGDSPRSGGIYTRAGTTVSLKRDAWQAQIATQGGSLVALTFNGHPLVRAWPTSQVRPCYHGATLAPWPNRLADGNYIFAGQTHQLALTEPELNNALHGLVCWENWTLIDSGPDTATMGTTILPQPGYPFQIELTSHWRLSGEGLTWTVTAINQAPAPAPFGIGIHPYLTAGEGSVDDWTLTVPAQTILITDPSRKLPTGRRQLRTSPLSDLRIGRCLKGVRLDDCFTDFTKGQISITRPDGTGVAMEWEPENLPFAQVFTSDLPDSPWDRTGVAIEPCSCAPNAFNAPEGPPTLTPREERTYRWSLKMI